MEITKKAKTTLKTQFIRNYSIKIVSICLLFKSLYSDKITKTTDQSTMISGKSSSIRYTKELLVGVPFPTFLLTLKVRSSTFSTSTIL